MGDSSGYERRIGRYCAELARGLIAATGVRADWRVLDVGCGSGALTAPLADLVGPERVVGVDPDREAVALAAERLPGVRFDVAPAEELPYSGFDDAWEPMEIPDGGPGVYLGTLDAPQREAVRTEFFARFGRPEGPFELSARAWYVLSRAPDTA